MKVDNEFKNLIPPLTAEEHKDLEENILKDGIRDSLVVWASPDGDVLVDGHNRLEIAERHGLPYQTVKRDFIDREDVKHWIILNQFGRRNLSPFQRSELALKLKPIIAEKAREQLSSHTEQGYQKSEKAVHTSKELAKVAGVSHDTIHKVETVLGKGSDETKEAARNGKISVNEAYKRTINENQRPKSDTTTAKEEHEAFKELKKTSPVVTFDEIEIDKNNQRIIALDLYHAITKMADSFEKMFMHERPNELAEDATGLTNEERAFLTARMYSVKNCTESIIKVLNGGK